jgi:hypothetical protein
MDQKMKECLKPHVLLHTVMGVGVGLVLAGLVPAVYGMAVTVGVVLVLVGLVGEFLRKSDS